jgi:hypothetical protein
MDRYGIYLGKTPPPPSKVRKPREPKRPKKTLSDTERESILSNLMRNTEGRMRLAASMINPLRQRMDYTSIARRVFQVEPLPQGVLPLYDVSSEAHYLDETGQQVASSSARRVSIPLFEIASNPQIPLSAIRERRFELIDRAQELAIQALTEVEGTGASLILNRASSGNNLIAELALDSLVEVFNSIERNELRVAHLFMNPQGFLSFRTRLGRDHLDLTTRSELRGAGVMGTLFGAQVNVSRAIPNGRIYMTSEPQFLGVIPMRTDLTVLNADNPEEQTTGFSVFEQIGMGCYNPRAVASLTFDREPVRPAEHIQVMEPEIVVPRMDRYALLRALANDGL